MQSMHAFRLHFLIAGQILAQKNGPGDDSSPAFPVIFRFGRGKSAMVVTTSARARRFARGLSQCLVIALACLVPGVGLAAGNIQAGDKQKSGGRAASSHLVIIGASYAKGWNPESVAGLKVVNRGAGGEQTHEVLSRFEKDVVASRPRAVIIWGFINDVFRSSPDEIGTKLVRTRENLTAMVGMARKQGIVPVVATEVTLPVPDGWSDRLMGWIGTLRGKQSQQQYINGHVQEMNRWLRQYAAANRITLLDFEKVLADEGGSRRAEYTTQDGTHLSAKAYAALSSHVAQQKLGL